MEETKTRGTAIVIPQLAESLVSATIGKWLKQPGDYVEQYEPICELITEKVTAELPSTVEGTLLELLANEGETLPVGAAVALIAEAGADPEETVPAAAAIADAIAGTNPNRADAMKHRYSPAVQRLAAEHGVPLSELKGTGLGGRITRKDVLHYLEHAKDTVAALKQGQSVRTAQQTQAAAHAQSGQQAQLTQAAQTAQTPSSSWSGSTAQAGGFAAPFVPDVPRVPVRSTGLHLTEPPAMPKIEVEGAQEGNSGEYLIDVTPIRNTIATRMRQSVTEIPHAWTMIEVDVTNLVLIRNKLKDEFQRKEGVNLTYLAFVLKAIVNAIKDYPILNSVWAVDKIIVKRDINISLAVGTEDAVFTPVIKKADQKSIAGLARDIDELSRKARSGQLKLDDMQGGTITVNNTGSFGSILSYPIINYPQAANITFEAIVKRPVVIQEMIAVRSMANICLSLDHRILDGVICGRFLQRVKENLESFSLETSLY